MNANEILRASALDILFDGRNKSYGAYELRKHYPQRLGIAVIMAFLFVAGLIFVFTGSFNNSIIPEYIPPEKGTLIVTQVEIPILKIEKPELSTHSSVTARPTTGSLAHTRMVRDNVTTSVARQTIGMTAGNEPLFDPGSVPGPPSVGVFTGSNTNLIPAVEEVFKPEQKEPMFPGGREAWLQFLMRNLEAPLSMAPGERITVQVRFIVEKDGTVNSFEVVRTGGSVFDKEVIRVLKKMPRWQPAVQNGRPVSVSFTQPVTFESVEE